MRILILGGGGFLGQRVAAALTARGTLRGGAITRLVQADLVAPPPVPGAEGAALDITDAAAVAALVGQGWDVIFHFAAVVSGQAEADLDLGMRVNLAGSIAVFDAASALQPAPVVVFTSSLAVYGGAVPDPIEDWTALQPQGSYGAQKAMGELLLCDLTRRGLLDGRAVRVPTVTIRPGRPNAAASSFMSSIFREPLQGQGATCPVAPDYPIWHSAPRTVVDNLIHAADLPREAIGPHPAFALPGRTDTVAEMIAAMTRVAGPEPARRIDWTPDPAVTSIVGGWRARIEPRRALALGFVRDRSFDDSVRWFLEDDAVR
jgi:nucleoside-diphosphate-sugar epimerase